MYWNPNSPPLTLLYACYGGWNQEQRKYTDNVKNQLKKFILSDPAFDLTNLCNWLLVQKIVYINYFFAPNLVFGGLIKGLLRRRFSECMEDLEEVKLINYPYVKLSTCIRKVALKNHSGLPASMN